MNEKRLQLAERRGALLNRIAAQRSELAMHSAALASVLAYGDRGLRGIDWMKHHPLAVGAAVAALTVARPRRALRWAQRSFFLWRGWQALRSRLGGML